MANTRVLCHDARLTSANALLGLAGSNSLYVWVGDHVPSANDEVPSLVDGPESQARAWRSLVAAKRVRAADACLLARRSDWETGTTYDQYDDASATLADDDFFVVVTSGDERHVWKCLENGGGANSTVAPDFVDVDAGGSPVRTTDDYVWKYLYSVDSTTDARFGTASLVPVVANASVAAAAVDGSVDAVLVDDPGEGYANYLSGEFAGPDLRVGNSTTYALGSLAASPNGFYAGCLLTLTAGSGSGQTRRVTNFFANGSGKYAVLASEFTTAPGVATGWRVWPEVLVAGADQTTDAQAAAVVNSVANGVYRVEVLDPGAGYTLATAVVVANGVVGVTRAAEVRPVLPPPGGHGFDASAELYARRAAVSVDLANGESNTVPDSGAYQRVGLMRDPVFAEVTVTTANLAGSFLTGEPVVVCRTRRLTANANTSSGNSVVVGDATAHFDESTRAGDYLLLTSEDGSRAQLDVVNSIVNSTFLTLAAAAGWSCTTVVVSLAEVTPVGTVDSAAGATLVVSDATYPVVVGERLVGTTSGATGTVGTVKRSGVTKGFATFVGLTRLAVVGTVGTFAADEMVYQGAVDAPTATGWLQSTTANGALLVSNVAGPMALAPVTGVDSHASATVTVVTPPEVRPGSGKMLAMENVDRVERGPSQTESIGFILDF